MKTKNSHQAVNDAITVAVFATRRALALKIGASLNRGAKKELANRAGVHITTIYKFFAGKFESEKVYAALSDYMKELKGQVNGLVENAEAVNNDKELES